MVRDQKVLKWNQEDERASRQITLFPSTTAQATGDQKVADARLVAAFGFACRRTTSAAPHRALAAGQRSEEDSAPAAATTPDWNSVRSR